jgi:hypothetical protein
MATFRWMLIVASVAVTIAFWIAWSWRAALSFAVVVVFLAVLAFVAGLGAEWLRGGSRGRFGGN